MGSWRRPSVSGLILEYLYLTSATLFLIYLLCEIKKKSQQPLGEEGILLLVAKSILIDTSIK